MALTDGVLFRNALFPDFSNGRFETVDIFVGPGKDAGVDEGTIEYFPTGSADLAIPEGKTEMIDASGLVASPGFVDPHSHFDLACFDLDWTRVRLAQGITCEVVGNCGLSVFPLPPGSGRGWLEAYRGVWGAMPCGYDGEAPGGGRSGTLAGWTRRAEEVPWTDGNGYAAALASRQHGSAHVVSLLGYSAVRHSIAGMEDRPLSPDESALAAGIIERELDRGAPGISIGIGYPPGLYADLGEYRLICSILGRRGRLLVAHIRDEGDHVIEALEEVLAWAEEGKCPLHVSHLKCFGRANHHKSRDIFEWIKKASSRVDLTFDVHPYDSGSTTMNSLLPPKVLDAVRGNWDLLLTGEVVSEVTSAIGTGLPGWENYGGVTGLDRIVPLGLCQPENVEFDGVAITDGASKRGLDPVTHLCHIIASEGGGASMAMFSMEESTVLDLLSHPLAMPATDGLYGRRPHPRTAGGIPRFLRRAVRETGRLGLVEALRKLTVYPRERFGVPPRKGDLVLFDPATVSDGSTFESPLAPPMGIRAVVCDGRVVTPR